MIPLLIRMKNNNSGVLRSRGDNFLFKNVDNFEISPKFAEIGRFEFGYFPRYYFHHHKEKNIKIQIDLSRRILNKLKNLYF